MDTVVAIRTRRSIRSYQERTVDRPLIEEVIRDAAQAPTTPLSEAQIFTVIEGARHIAACGDRALEFARRNRPDGPGYDWVESEWLKQFVGEQLVTVKTKRGFARIEWQKLRERNEALDTRVYARAAAWIAGLDRWSDDRWAEAEREVRVEVGAAARPPRPAQPGPTESSDGWLGRRRGWLK